ncbi:MAG: site-specific integrase [Candidatus Bathyarchaeia archaeon]
MEPQTAIKCPECGSSRVFKDGLRKAPSNALSNQPIQRYRCADYGHRWSEHIVLNVHGNNNQISRISVMGKAKNLASTTKLNVVAEKERHSPTENELKAAPQIEKLITQLVNDGRKPSTIANYRKSFKLLLRAGADLFDPESCKAVLAKAEIKDSTKALITYNLAAWFDFNCIIWRAPTYSNDGEPIYVPTEAELDQLIAGLGKKTAVYCAMLKDTGARPGEISRLRWQDIDFGQRNVRLRAEKNSNNRVLPLSAKTIDMLCQLPRNKEHIFSNADDMRSCYSIQRRNLSKKIANPNIALICFKTFRHWKGTTEQHKTKDPWHVKEILGHKKISSTEKYIHLEQMMYLENSDQFTVKVADTLDAAIKLMEVGFEFHATVEGHQLFRKRK